MSDSDLFLICPVCGTKIEVTYAEGQRRPTALDEGRALYTCPLCGGSLIRVINPTFNERWNLTHEVEYTSIQRKRLLDMTGKFDESNSAKLKELATKKEANE